MKNNIENHFLKIALQAVLDAEHLIMDYYKGDIAVELKKDLSPVTIADKEAEKTIIKTIQKAFPDHGFLGEESGDTNLHAEYKWIIDPIDGTKNFTRKIPLFATELALMKNDDVIAGVSNVLGLKELYYASKNEGAYSSSDIRLNVSSTNTLSKSHITLGGLNHFQTIEKIDQLLSVIKGSSRVRAIGDAYAYHLLASGRLEAVIEAKIRIWDVASLMLIIEEAGGKVTDIEGNKLTKDSTTILATNGRIHEEILGLLN